MFPGINMNQIKKMMKDVENIAAEKVIIELTNGGKMIIASPQVMRMNVMGSDSFQITGEVSTKEAEKEPLYRDEDLHFIMQQTGRSEDDVKEALINNEGDIAKTILDLKK